MKDILEEIATLERLNKELRADVEKYKELRELDVATMKAMREDAEFGGKCRFYVGAMLELRRRGAPGFIEMCIPMLVRLLDSIQPMDAKP